MDKVEHVLNKILGIVESIADAHSSIKTFMTITLCSTFDQYMEAIKRLQDPVLVEVNIV